MGSYQISSVYHGGVCGYHLQGSELVCLPEGGTCKLYGSHIIIFHIYRGIFTRKVDSGFFGKTEGFKIIGKVLGSEKLSYSYKSWVTGFYQRKLKIDFAMSRAAPTFYFCARYLGYAIAACNIRIGA